MVWRLNNNKLRQQTWCRRWRYLLTRCSAVSSSSQQSLRRNTCTAELKDKANLWTYICHLRQSRKIWSQSHATPLSHTHTYGAGNTAHVGTVELLPPRLLRLLFLRRRLEKSGVLQYRHWLVRQVANIKPARLLADFNKIKGQRMKSACVLSFLGCISPTYLHTYLQS